MTHIRKLGYDDYENYLQLINDFRDTCFTRDDFEKTLKEIQTNSDIWVIEQDERLVCVATILYERKFIFDICRMAHIEDVCTKKEYRGQGLGKQLISFLIEEAKRNNCYKISLVCSQMTSYFYKQCKFEERGVHMSLLIPSSPNVNLSNRPPTGWIN